MSRYSNDIRIKAVNRMKETSLSQTAKEMNISKQTLRRWKQLSSEPNQQPDPVSKNGEMAYEDEAESSSTAQEQAGTFELNEKLRAELEEARRLKKAADATIDYLIADNRQLRLQCDKYLRALSLLVQ